MDDWQKVYERYGSLVWETVYRILGDHAETLDCCQEVFAELLARSTPQPVHNWAGYLKWLATRRAIDHLRRRRANVARFERDGDIALAAANQSGPDAEIIARELREQLKDQLTRLPAQQAQAFWLVSVEELTYQETSEQLGIEVNQVGVLVHRARRRLREWLVELNPGIHRGTQPT